ncbi:MAG: nucleotidyltransferase domain-containing protein [Anaerolineae bacterium]
MSEVAMPKLTVKEHRALDAYLNRLRERFPGEILQVILFGSKARGDSQPSSDIDVLTVVRQESWPLREEINTLAARVSLEYDVLLGPRVIGRERWERMERDRFGLYQSIITEGIPLKPAFGSS